MAQKFADHGAEMRDTVVKSSLTGVAATMLAVTAFSPAGFGGVIGTSLASGSNSSSTAADNVYSELPPFPSPLSSVELDDIRSRLARTSASLEITRAATDERIERIRSIAVSDGLVTFSPMSNVGEVRVNQAAAAPAPVETAARTVVIQPEHRDANLELAALLLAHENI
ncbi:hypothetical protein U91I_01546 [alpha proteobacterium U9-1i]|nr:hypothetical protein U91I_01546 [alpha proteobacterium U9-1i]